MIVASTMTIATAAIQAGRPADAERLVAEGLRLRLRHEEERARAALAEVKTGKDRP